MLRRVLFWFLASVQRIFTTVCVYQHHFRAGLASEAEWARAGAGEPAWNCGCNGASHPPPSAFPVRSHIGLGAHRWWRCRFSEKTEPGWLRRRGLQKGALASTHGPPSFPDPDARQGSPKPLFPQASHPAPSTAPAQPRRAPHSETTRARVRSSGERLSAAGCEVTCWGAGRRRSGRAAGSKTADTGGRLRVPRPAAASASASSPSHAPRTPSPLLWLQLNKKLRLRSGDTHQPGASAPPTWRRTHTAAHRRTRRPRLPPNAPPQAPVARARART